MRVIMTKITKVISSKTFSNKEEQIMFSAARRENLRKLKERGVFIKQSIFSEFNILDAIRNFTESAGMQTEDFPEILKKVGIETPIKMSVYWRNGWIKFAEKRGERQQGELCLIPAEMPIIRMHGYRYGGSYMKNYRFDKNECESFIPDGTEGAAFRYGR